MSTKDRTWRLPRDATCPECGVEFTRAGLRMHRFLKHNVAAAAETAPPAESSPSSSAPPSAAPAPSPPPPRRGLWD